MDVGSGTVARVVRVISFFADKPEVTIKSLSAGLGMAPSTCHRLLDLLSQEGIISHDAVRRAYRPGPELFRIAGQVHAGNDVRVQALRSRRKTRKSRGSEHQGKHGRLRSSLRGTVVPPSSALSPPLSSNPAIDASATALHE